MDDVVQTKDSSNRIFSLEGYQICIISDFDEKKHEIGTGFLFLRNDWIVTAAHVVIHDGIARQNLYAEFPTGEPNKLKLKVVAIHKEHDIALLRIIDSPNPCKKPLFPGYDDLSVSKGLVTCGFTPSKGRSITVSLVKKYDKQLRERTNIETILEFEGQGIEPGSSGGPIFGDGGVVLGLLINLFTTEEAPNKVFARATSIQNLMNAIVIGINNEYLTPFADIDKNT